MLGKWKKGRTGKSLIITRHCPVLLFSWCSQVQMAIKCLPKISWGKVESRGTKWTKKRDEMTGDTQRRRLKCVRKVKLGQLHSTKCAQWPNWWIETCQWEGKKKEKTDKRACKKYKAITQSPRVIAQMAFFGMCANVEHEKRRKSGTRIGDWKWKNLSRIYSQNRFRSEATRWSERMRAKSVTRQRSTR